ncbi:MAG: hypothetical protein ABR574_05975 [Cryomorphaceae bacterium]|nr:hypothetical protein [Flavobacteriales bacterium]
MNHLITFAEAQTLIENFVNHPILGDIALNKAVSGTIDKNSFQTQEEPKPGLWSGKMAWYCWDTNSPYVYHSFFLAFEQFNNYNSNAAPGQPEHLELQIANKQHTFTPGQSVGDMLLNEQHALLNPINFKLSRAVVNSCVQSFGTDFPKDQSNAPFNTHPFGFFNNNSPSGGGQSEWEAFIGQPGLVAIRYYFGFDGSETTNKIRVILVGVNGSGKNMLSNASSDLILERCEP